MFYPLFYVNLILVEWPEFVIPALVLVHLKEKILVILSFSLVKNT